MSRTIPIALQAHLDQPATTTCRLLRIKPVGESAFGYASTNRAIRYDDGDGELVYRVMSGFEHSAIVSSADTSVDNAEAKGLLLPANPITEAKVLAGAYDGAEFTIYEVNYEDLTAGRHAVLMHGYFGKVRAARGRAFVAELRGLIDLLRQQPWQKWQRRCRVVRFGSQVGEERFPCKYDLTPEWIEDEPVTSVGAETTRTFTASGLAQAADYFAPGAGIWTSGANVGLPFDIEAFASGGVISLLFPMPFPVQTGDTFDIRRDCTREWEGHNSCETYANRENFRGEPKIKPADASGAQVPGAQVGPGSGGASFEPPRDTE